MKARVLLTTVGFPVALVGAWASWVLLPSQLVNDSGCVFYPCTPPTTRAIFVLALGGLIAGLAMLGLAATGMEARARLTALGFPLSLFGAWASWLVVRGLLGSW